MTNQTFDFIGPPLCPRAGQFSNLGRVYVNNDATNLYLGLEQVMTYAGNNVFLFLESPRLTGVSSMRGVGNGISDPAGEGADGLDCLENLSFTNFTPSIGCLLGDEYADGQFRSFARSNLALNIGQGIFRLSAGLSNVPGVRLQQFNRSPNQIPATECGVTNEQSADFMELAIPLSELGGLQPGDVIKLGALVGGGGFDAGTQKRQLDSSALGCFLSGSGLSNVVLEGVSVRLASDGVPPSHIWIAWHAPSQFLLTWSAVVGQRYDLEYAERLTNFSPISDPSLPRLATTNTESFIVTPGTNQTGFYRIRRVP